MINEYHIVRLDIKGDIPIYTCNECDPSLSAMYITSLTTKTGIAHELDPKEIMSHV